MKIKLLKKAKDAMVGCIVAHPKLVTYGLSFAIVSIAISFMGHEAFAMKRVEIVIPGP